MGYLTQKGVYCGFPTYISFFVTVTEKLLSKEEIGIFHFMVFNIHSPKSVGLSNVSHDESKMYAEERSQGDPRNR